MTQPDSGQTTRTNLAGPHPESLNPGPRPAAVILAGGRGERLRPHTDDRPKPMIEVSGVPLIAYLLGWLKGYGVTEIVVSCGYHWEALRSALGTGARWGLELQYAVERERLGRGGGIRYAMQSAGLDRMGAAPVIVTNGDNLVDFDLDEMLDRHAKTQALITLALAPLVTARGIVDTDENDLVTGFREKPELPYWINAGVYVLDSGVTSRLPRKGDHEETLFPALAQEGRLAAYKTRRLWRTVDTAKDLTTIDTELQAGLEVPCLDWTKSHQRGPS